jgi:hypothetical protein
MAALLSLCILHTAAATVQPGVTYPAGTRIDTPGTGVSFTIPKGWSGILPRGHTFFVMGSQPQKAYIFVLVEKKTVAQARAMMTDPVPLGGGLTLQPDGELVQQGTRLTGRYSVAGSREPMVGYVETHVSKRDLGVSYLAISAPKTADGVQKVVQALAEDTALESP